MKLIMAMLAGSLFSAAFGVPQYGFFLALAAAFAILIYHSI